MARSKDKIVPVVRAAEEADQINEDEENALKVVFELLKSRIGHDFSKYKRNTVLRRLARRMQLCHRATIVEYLQYLSEHTPEVQGLFDDLLISVTTFFRDPEAWEALKAQVIAPLVQNIDPNDQIRAWVPGCATGEEAFSLAILFHEEFERQKIERSLIIFASDLDESSISIARGGLYPRAISADVSESRLERYFRPEGDHYRVVSGIRDNIVFAVHNLLRDPPFSRLHVVSCRNLLIYLDRELQEQAMGIFSYACRDESYLFLGAAETVDESLFHALDKKHRIAIHGQKTAGSPCLRSSRCRAFQELDNSTKRDRLRGCQRLKSMSLCLKRSLLQAWSLMSAVMSCISHNQPRVFFCKAQGRRRTGLQTW